MNRGASRRSPLLLPITRTVVERVLLCQCHYHRERKFSLVRSISNSMMMASSKNPLLRQRSVVSSFICKKPAKDGATAGFEVSIFKRSQDVRTYRGKWAACSGSIENTDTSPEIAAIREIQEETTLTEKDIYLLRRGKPFSLVDESLETEWTIYPFAWMLKEGAKEIQFDWEHTEYRFIAPKDFVKYETVPNLEFGLRRVLVGTETGAALDALRDDHESGAQGMALKALEMLLKAVRGRDLEGMSGTEEFWRELRMVAWHLAKNGRPNMGAAIEASLFGALDAIRAQVVAPKGVCDIELSDFKAIAESVIREQIAAREPNLQRLARAFTRFVRDTEDQKGDARQSTGIKIVTLSSSGIATRCLADLIRNFASSGQRKIDVCILESRPKFEGVAFANNLLNSLSKEDQTTGDHSLSNDDLVNALKIEISSDASVATILQGGTDYVVLGADKVFADGSASNKIGSLTAAVLAKTLPLNNTTKTKTKVVTVFGTDKITAETTEHFNAEYNASAEMTETWPASYMEALEEKKRKTGFQVEVRNGYFELVPPEYIDSYITEEGAITRERITELSVRSAELEGRLFEDV